MRRFKRQLGWLISASIVAFPACGGGGGGGTTVDTNPPQFAQIQVVPSLLEEGKVVQAEALVIDLESGVAEVRIQVRYPNGYGQVHQMQRETGTNRFKVQWTIPSGVGGEQNEVQVVFIASDMRGNIRNLEYTPSPRLAKQPPNPPSW